MARPAPLQLEDLHKRFGRVTALDGATLAVAAGQTTVVLGPSGCGKTTLLRIAAGLVRPDRGRVLVGGEDVTQVPARRRSLGMVFQDGALYPHWDGRRNVLAYYLFRRRPPELDAEARARYARTAEILGVALEQLLDRRPGTLSPGERQRVALGRCVTRAPTTFLLDEPFAHLDQEGRRDLRVRLRRLLREVGVTTVYVTHDQQEAPLIGERLAVMREGRVVQQGTWIQLYREPRDRFVASFLTADPIAPAMSFLNGDALPWAPDGTDVGVRPEAWRVLGSEEASGEVKALEGRVVEGVGVPARGSVLVEVAAAAGSLHAYLPEAAPLPAGPLWLAPSRAHVFDRASGRCIDVLAGPPAASRGPDSGAAGPGGRPVAG